MSPSESRFAANPRPGFSVGKAMRVAIGYLQGVLAGLPLLLFVLPASLPAPPAPPPPPPPPVAAPAKTVRAAAEVALAALDDARARDRISTALATAPDADRIDLARAAPAILRRLRGRATPARSAPRWRGQGGEPKPGTYRRPPRSELRR